MTIYAARPTDRRLHTLFPRSRGPSEYVTSSVQTDQISFFLKQAISRTVAKSIEEGARALAVYAARPTDRGPHALLSEAAAPLALVIFATRTDHGHVQFLKRARSRTVAKSIGKGVCSKRASVNRSLRLDDSGRMEKHTQEKILSPSIFTFFVPRIKGEHAPLPTDRFACATREG